MGNRCVITTKENFEKNGVGVYMHWNGGRDSVEPILAYCKMKGYRPPETDCYGWARLCQVIGNALGGTLSVGIDTVDRLDCDNFDNGVYIIKNWEIVDRKYFDGEEQHEYDFDEMLKGVNESMPKDEQIDPEYFNAEELPTNMLCIGDTIFKRDPIYDKIEKCRVVGISDDGVPYIDKYHKDDPASNPNNYLHDSSYRCVVSDSLIQKVGC